MTTTLIADETLTAGLARMLAADLRPGHVVLLDGPVGAGKTHFARALIRARQGDAAEDVPSPTFTLVQTYDDPMGSQIWHADLYRLTDPSELVELGLDEAMADAVCLIEWPDRLDAVPPGALRIALAPQDDPDLRAITMDFPGADRLAARAAFVAQAGHADARVLPLAGDASARRYFRLPGVGVLMDDASGSVMPFLTMTGWLRDRGFGAPAVLAQDAARGLLLLQDLGDDLVARVLQDRPDLTDRVHGRITDLLVDLHRLPVPPFVAPLDGAAMGDLAALFPEYYPGAALPGLPALIARLHDDLCRDVDPATEAAQIARYLAATGADGAPFRAAYALIGAQRALRILGVFARLAIRDGKPRYLAFMPRVWAHLRRNLAHPALAPLRDMLADVPPPDAALLDRIARCRP